MAIYLASFDMKALTHDYAPLYALLRTAEAHQAQSSTWLIESREPLLALSNRLLSFLDKDDSLFLVEMNPSTAWAATHLAEKTGEWLQNRRP